MSGCCNEHGCRRTKPFMLMRGGLSDLWYVVTDYRDLGDGQFEARRKHRLPDETQERLNRMLDALHAGDGEPEPGEEMT